MAFYTAVQRFSEILCERQWQTEAEAAAELRRLGPIWPEADGWQLLCWIEEEQPPHPDPELEAWFDSLA